jgi:hypothetical protein
VVAALYGLRRPQGQATSILKRRRRVQKLLLGSALTAEEFSVLSREPVDQAGYFAYIDNRSARLMVDREDALLRLSIVERKEFSEMLEDEVSKAAIFYSEALLPDLRASIANRSFDVASRELLETMSFCVTNIITFSPRAHSIRWLPADI